MTAPVPAISRFAIDWRSPLQRAGVAIAVSGVLHLIAPLVSGFAAASLLLVIAGLLDLAIGEGLRRELRWLGWIAFVLMLIGSLLAWSAVGRPGPVPVWLLWLILVADLAAAGNLFMALWKPRAA